MLRSGNVFFDMEYCGHLSSARDDGKGRNVMLLEIFSKHVMIGVSLFSGMEVDEVKAAFLG